MYSRGARSLPFPHECINFLFLNTALKTRWIHQTKRDFCCTCKSTALLILYVVISRTGMVIKEVYSFWTVQIQILELALDIMYFLECIKSMHNDRYKYSNRTNIHAFFFFWSIRKINLVGLKEGLLRGHC
jgi:hypothetical protein